LLGSINELLVERKSTKIAEVAHGGNFGFEKRLLEEKMCAYYMTIIVIQSGVVMGRGKRDLETRSIEI